MCSALMYVWPKNETFIVLAATVDSNVARAFTSIRLLLDLERLKLQWKILGLYVVNFHQKGAECVLIYPEKSG